MILILFISLAILSVILFVVGFFMDLQYMRLIGFAILFLTGIGALDGIQYNTGSIINTTYNYAGGVLTTSGDIVTDVNTTFGDHTIGLILAMFGAFALIVDLINSWSRTEDYGEAYR